MKKLIVMLALMLGCDHQAERAHTAVQGAGHQAGLELCLQAAQQQTDRGEAEAKIRADFNDCADAAAKANGGK